MRRSQNGSGEPSLHIPDMQQPDMRSQTEHAPVRPYLQVSVLSSCPAQGCQCCSEYLETGATVSSRSPDALALGVVTLFRRTMHGMLLWRWNSTCTWLSARLSAGWR